MDAAGQEAMRRAITIGEKVGLNLRVLDLQGGKDPAELAQSNPKAWREMSEKTESVHQFLMDLAFKKHDGTTGEGQKVITSELLQVWARLTNAVEQAFWLKKLAGRLGVGMGVLERELQKLTMGLAQKEETVKPLSETKERSRREMIERFLIAVSLQAEGYGERLWTALDEAWFENGYLARLLESLKTANEQYSGKTIQKLLSTLPPEQQDLVKDLYLSEDSVFEQSSEDVLKSFERSKEILWDLHARARLNTLATQLTTPDVQDTRRRELQAEYQTLAKKLGADGD